MNPNLTEDRPLFASRNRMNPNFTEDIPSNSIEESEWQIPTMFLRLWVIDVGTFNSCLRTFQAIEIGKALVKLNKP